MLNVLNEVNSVNKANVRGRFSTAQRQNKVARSSRSTDNESDFGDLGYEVTVHHEDHVMAEDGTKKELHVLEQQLRKNMKLHRKSNELQQEQITLVDETTPV